MMRPRLLARVLLLATALIWGATFIVVKQALTLVSPIVFNALRMTLAALVLLLLNHRALRALRRPQVLAGLLVGISLAAGYYLQTAGLVYTTPTKSAFITGLVVVVVPLFSLIPGVRPAGIPRPGLPVLLGCIVAFIGLYLLTTPPGTTLLATFTVINRGDLLTLACTCAFAAHLLTLGRVTPTMPPGALASVQIATASILFLLLLPTQPQPIPRFTPSLVIALLVTALLGTAAAFTIQSFAQRTLPPAQTGVLLAFEPVFAWLTSRIVLHEHTGPRSLIGAALILLAMLLIELSPTPGPAEIPA